MNSQSFKALLEEAQTGDPDAVGKLLDSCRNYLLVIANTSIEPDLAAKGGASDLVQETLMDAHQDFVRFHGGTRADLLKWLRGILAHNVLDFCRAYRNTDKRDIGREHRIQDSQDLKQIPSPGETPSKHIAAQEQAERLERALSQLPKECRMVIELRNKDRLRFAEIGTRMGRSEDACRMLWKRAVERLQQELDALK